jgi:hypothetical protein
MKLKLVPAISALAIPALAHAQQRSAATTEANKGRMRKTSSK